MIKKLFANFTRIFQLCDLCDKIDKHKKITKYLFDAANDKAIRRIKELIEQDSRYKELEAETEKLLDALDKQDKHMKNLTKIYLKNKFQIKITVHFVKIIKFLFQMP